MELNNPLVERVLGFAFTPNHRVVLAEVAIPPYPSAGKDGVKGEVSPGVTPEMAMAIAFCNQTGINCTTWKVAGLMFGNGWRTHVLTATSDEFYLIGDETRRPGYSLYPIGSVKTVHAVDRLVSHVPTIVMIAGPKTDDIEPVPFFTLAY